MTAKKRTVFLRPLAPAESLDTLEAETRRFALHCLQTSGKIIATLMLVTEKGIFLFVPNSMQDEQAKDQFAIECRLMAVATQARMCATVMEMWVASVLPGEEVREKMPSQEPDRIEAVMIALEGHRQEPRTYVLPVIRDRKGRVARLSDSIVPIETQLGGRFAGILPSIWSSDADAKAAEFVLSAASR